MRGIGEDVDLAAWKDIQDLEITEDLWKERVAWRARICVAAPDYFGNERG